MTDIFTMFIAAAICAALAVGSWKARVLDKSGGAAAFLIGFVTFSVPDDGWKWFLILLIFLAVSSYMTHYKYEVKRTKGFAQEKGGARGWPNVAANGAVAGVLALMSTSIRPELALAAFLSAVATANADTLGTEVGLLSPSEPRLITHLGRKVPAGTSGGITVLGELATLLGALLIGVVASLLGMTRGLGWSPGLPIWNVIVGGLAGCTADSVIGATVQGMYRCSVCGKITENRRHCNNPSELVRGYTVIDNNVVNLIATVIGAVVALGLASYFPF